MRPSSASTRPPSTSTRIRRASLLEIRPPRRPEGFLRAPECADLPCGWALGHPQPGQIRGQRPASSRREPGAAGLSGRDEAFGAESSFQALRGHGRGHVGMGNCQTPPLPTKTPASCPGSGLRIFLSCLWVAESGRTDWGCTGSREWGRERPPPNLTFCGTARVVVAHGVAHAQHPPSGVAPC